MSSSFEPVLKRGMADRLASRIKAMIRDGEYQQGDRLPAIMEMARRFGVGHPTIREALKKLEAMGFVDIRHGSGVYVTRNDDVLIVASPDYSGTVTRKLLQDLIAARMLLEVQSAREAARLATPAHIDEMRRALAIAGQNLRDNTIQLSSNMSFHRQIAAASGNAVLAQLIDVLVELFPEEQRIILGIIAREQDHQEHRAILAAIEARDEAAAADRMRTHLQGVEDALRRWDPEQHPVV
jgi:GntR family transcriptional repressor for pyruvate dehydrogenase complex